MPGRIPDPRNKDAAIARALRDDGASSKQDAASRSAGPGPGVHPDDYADWSVDDLRRRAAELDIAGRSTMHKDELVAALRNR